LCDNHAIQAKIYLKYKRKEEPIMVNETTNFCASVIVKDTNQVDTPVMYLNATLDGGNKNVNISIGTVNQELAKSNAASVKTQYNEFMTAVKARAKELGYIIF
jgi:hypothetical protein